MFISLIFCGVFDEYLRRNRGPQSCCWEPHRYTDGSYAAATQSKQHRCDNILHAASECKTWSNVVECCVLQQVNGALLAVCRDYVCHWQHHLSYPVSVSVVVFIMTSQRCCFA